MGTRAGPARVKLALDHHYSPSIARVLRERGFDVVAAVEVGWEAENDEPLLVLCQGDERCLLTNNVADFAVIARAWQTEGRTHAGLIFTSDVGWPRNRDTIGRYVDALAELMTANATVGSFADRIHWL
jgi:predicted nuclease of predicted toxin-antitoxin system